MNIHKDLISQIWNKERKYIVKHYLFFHKSKAAELFLQKSKVTKEKNDKSRRTKTSENVKRRNIRKMFK